MKTVKLRGTLPKFSQSNRNNPLGNLNLWLYLQAFKKRFDVLRELFPPRLILNLAKKIIKIPASLEDAIKVGIQETLAEAGLNEDPSYISASTCFSSRMEGVS